MRDPNSLLAQKALKVLQMRYPDNWKELLRESRQILESTLKELQLGKLPEDIDKAYNHCLINGKSSVLRLVPAAHLLKRKYLLEAEHIQLELEEISIEEMYRLNGFDLGLCNNYTNSKKLDDIMSEMVCIGNAFGSRSSEIAYAPMFGNWGNSKTR